MYLNRIQKQMLDQTVQDKLNKVDEHTEQLAQIAKKTKFVTYELFGVNGQKKYYNNADGNYYLDSGFTQIYNTDDGIKIKECHDYANANDLPVINLQGHYVIRGTRQIPVLTNTNLGHSVFHIDESYNNLGEVFSVNSKYQFQTVDSTLYSTILSKLVKRTEPTISELKDYNNHFMVIKDANNQVGSRSGTTTTWDMTDFHYIDELGRLVGEVSWNWVGITSITAKRLEENYLVIEGGAFLLNGKWDNGLTSNAYGNNGFKVTRSRTIIKDQFVGLEYGIKDGNVDPVDGFYNFDNVYDVTLENVKLIPRIYNGSIGTYGITGSMVLDSNFKNVSANGTSDHWGVVGTNLFKNFRVDNCSISRVDVHFHGWNIHIKDSYIGEGGISLTGGGLLKVENTKVKNKSFVYFRMDYGAKWDGDIDISDSKLVVFNTTDQSHILNFAEQTHDFKYEITYGRNITINNFEFDYSLNSGSIGYLIWFPTSGINTANNQRRRFPLSIKAEGVKVTGREQGIRLLYLPDPYDYYVPKSGGINVDELTTNTTWEFKDIDLEKLTTSTAETASGVHILIKADGAKTYNANSIYPNIVLTGCKYNHMQFYKAALKILFMNCEISSLDAYSGGKEASTKITFSHCDFKPNLASSTQTVFTIVGNGYFNHCIFYPIVYGGVEDLEASKTKYDLFDTNLGTVKHSNFFSQCKLSSRFLSVHADLPAKLKFS